MPKKEVVKAAAASPGASKTIGGRKKRASAARPPTKAGKPKAAVGASGALLFPMPIYLLGRGAEQSCLPYSIAFVEGDETKTTSQWMARLFGGGRLASNEKQHASKAAAIKYINATVRNKMRGLKNDEGGPRLQRFYVVSPDSRCPYAICSPGHSVMQEVGIPTCCANLSDVSACPLCFSGLR